MSENRKHIVADRILNEAAYICMSLNVKGRKDILGIWIGEAEGAKYWLSVCDDLKNREVKDILIACMDRLKRLPVARRTYPLILIFHEYLNHIITYF